MLAGYLLALLLTLLIEGGVAFVMGLRTRQQMLAVVMVNLVTHPILHYTLLLLGQLGADVTLAIILGLEMAVAAAEGLLLVYMFGRPKGRLWLIALLANGASYLAGLVLFPQ